MNENPLQKRFEKIPGMNCFVCAPPALNASGLHLEFEATQEGARTEFQIPVQFQSYPGFVHGGILGAILDETMAYAGLFRKLGIPFTKRLELEFLRPVRAEQTYVCEAFLSTADPKEFQTRGEIRDTLGAICVQAEALFIIPSRNVTERMLGRTRLGDFEDFFVR